ncbi:MAG: FAD-binding oxidoreductase [Rhizobiales bacterium]|nr:FAD-binding oxidoreductase [Hyphomicrobiales bacterium]
MAGFVATDRLQSWGRVTRPSQNVASPHFADELPSLVAGAGDTRLGVGLMRSYGDSNLNPNGSVIRMTGLDRIHHFDPASRVLRADAGLSLDSLIRTVLPHGLFPAVVPGTRFVTLGGAVGNDIHGKNHHRFGTFGNHVRRLSLMRSDGRRIELGPDDESGLFAATIGGLGLTGLIEWVEIALRAIPGAMIDAETIPFESLEEFFALADESITTHEHTVSWIDCTRIDGTKMRGLFMRGNCSADPDRPPHAARPRLGMPLELPRFALNPLTLSLFNETYYRFGRLRAGRSKVHYAPFFFPLDGIMHWNRLYGRDGMFQYQCAVPPGASLDATAELLKIIAASGEGSFLAVLKTFGSNASPGLLSFPREGTTLALDFRNRGRQTLELLAQLDAVVFEAGGRLYPAKDGRMSARMFQSGYPRLEAFTAHVDPHFSSAFWRRVAP